MDEHAIQFARRARDADVANLGRLKAVFIDDRVRFPYHAFDDQVDALIQFLTWTRENPPVAPRIIASSLGLRPR